MISIGLIVWFSSESMHRRSIAARLNVGTMTVMFGVSTHKVRASADGPDTFNLVSQTA